MTSGENANGAMSAGAGYGCVMGPDQAVCVKLPSDSFDNGRAAACRNSIQESSLKAIPGAGACIFQTFAAITPLLSAASRYMPMTSTHRYASMCRQRCACVMRISRQNRQGAKTLRTNVPIIRRTRRYWLDVFSTHQRGRLRQGLRRSSHSYCKPHSVHVP